MMEPTLANSRPTTPTWRLRSVSWDGRARVSVAMGAPRGATSRCAGLWQGDVPRRRRLHTSARADGSLPGPSPQPALNETWCHPVAPFGTTSTRAAVCVYPDLSVARTVTEWFPDATSTDPAHCTHVSLPGTRPRSASRQASPSSRNSTFSMPVCCAQACPPTRTEPALTSPPSRGTSTRDSVLTGPFADQPRSVQYAVKSSNRVTSRSVTHLVADTKP